MAELREIAAKNLVYLRTHAGMTQAELAQRLNYSDKSVSKWERGDGLPDVTVLAEMGKIFDVTVDWIITEHAKPHPPRGITGMTRNRQLITLISLLGVLYSALMVFIVLWTLGQVEWFAFLAALPVSAVVYLVLNSIWGDRRLNVYILSVLLWTVILTVYMGLLLYGGRNLWLLFLLGIPGQLVVILASKIVVKR